MQEAPPGLPSSDAYATCKFTAMVAHLFQAERGLYLHVGPLAYL